METITLPPELRHWLEAEAAILDLTLEQVIVKQLTDAVRQQKASAQKPTVTRLDSRRR